VNQPLPQAIEVIDKRRFIIENGFWAVGGHVAKKVSPFQKQVQKKGTDLSHAGPRDGRSVCLQEKTASTIRERLALERLQRMIGEDERRRQVKKKGKNKSHGLRHVLAPSVPGPFLAGGSGGFGRKRKKRSSTKRPPCQATLWRRLCCKLAKKSRATATN